MSATVHALGHLNANRLQTPPARPGRPSPAPLRVASEPAWLVDVVALANCRALLSGHEPAPARAGQQSLLDVPPAYEQFCLSHFASVKRLRPELRWEDACQAYAVALSAHAVLCDALDAEREQKLARNWDALRGASGLDWPQAASLVADGCSALARLDPLAMRR